MNNNGSPHPNIGYFEVSQRDKDIDFLSRKICPIHSTPLSLDHGFSLGGDDARLRYQCKSCGIYVDFKGDELKSYSVGHALDVVNEMRIEERELAAAKNNPTAEGDIEI